jgi:membrane protein
MAGGVFVAIGLELSKKGLALYLGTVPGLSLIYGAFATVPILLLWLYIAWLVLLFGAVIAAYLPSLLAGVARRGDTPGWRFELALETLAQLNAARVGGGGGLSTAELAERLRVDPLQVEPVMDALVRLGWAAQLEDGREVLLIEPGHTPVAPLVSAVLLAGSRSTEAFTRHGRWDGVMLQAVLPPLS